MKVGFDGKQQRREIQPTGKVNNPTHSSRTWGSAGRRIPGAGDGSSRMELVFGQSGW